MKFSDGHRINYITKKVIDITVCSSNGFKIYHAKINDLQKNFFATPTSLMSQLAKYKEDTFVHPQQKMKWFMNTRFPCEMQWPEKYIFWYLEISICWSMCFVVLYISDQICTLIRKIFENDDGIESNLSKLMYYW